ncbi:hypothetical protein VC83_06669 [Pseudogymnoascus destructans]|uniref:Uncharacterized protein n=1 Tax=Pseudogymnoascus destructans TaxID=655981 RepID=A0A177A5S8_9PEZI|nr:uncharacterized protein VC83_06669 [Pseudogymnoascus destructans]OAF56473.1 hypothetical protein VC83_06669 [Pseudogymnoascus destructans]
MSNSTAPVGVVMPVIISSRRWLQAFQLIPILALNTMLQPVGLILGISAYNGVWLRASPLMCALDVLALISRQLTRYFLLEAPKVAFELQTTVSAADFELEASVGEEDDDEDDQAPLVKRTKDTTEGASDDAMESTSTRYALSKTDFGEKETTGDSGSTAIQGQSPGPSSRTGEGDNDSSAPLIQEQFTNPAIRTAASDLEAANDSQDNDPLMSARFLRFKVIFDYFDTALLGIGCILHVLGLPRLHPPLPGEQHLLHWRLELSKSPRFHAFDDRRLVHHNGSELLRHVPAIPPGLGPWSRFLAMGKPLWLSPQAFVRGWMDRHPTIQNIVAIVSTTVDRWAQKAMVTLFWARVSSRSSWSGAL